MMRGMQDDVRPPQTGDSDKSGADGVVDEWALLNELDITAYSIEQERRRREESDQKYKVKMDLMNQMREKSQSQQLARTMAEQEWKDSKDRLDDWNEQERKRSDKRERRMERRRQMLLRQMEMAQSRTTQVELPKWPRWDLKLEKSPTASTPLEIPLPPSEKVSPSEQPD